MTVRRVITFVSLIVLLTLPACNLPRPNATEVATGDPIGTAAAQTVAALSTELQSKVTNTPEPSNTPEAQVATATRQPEPGTATATTSVKPCDRGEFVSDVTVDDGTTFKPGETFTKTWRLKNTGSCTWTTSYRVVFDSGNALGAPASFNLPASVAPDGIIDISVQMKAPEIEKEYESYWKLQNASGITFGLGESGDKKFWVKIKVAAASLPFAVTKVVLSTANANVTAGCPYNFPLTAQITSTAAGKVTYFWERSDGAKSGMQEVVFDGEGTKTVNFSWSFPASFDGSVKIYIDNPNHQYFSTLNIKLTCN
ncbi:MAG: NBR1-Ig-like domain-containing protein [Bellilinea sp.]